MTGDASASTTVTAGRRGTLSGCLDKLSAACLLGFAGASGCCLAASVGNLGAFTGCPEVLGAGLGASACGRAGITGVCLGASVSLNASRGFAGGTGGGCGALPSLMDDDGRVEEEGAGGAEAGGGGAGASGCCCCTGSAGFALEGDRTTVNRPGAGEGPRDGTTIGSGTTVLTMDPVS